MKYAYMGIFSSVFNWVLNKILSPVFNFIASLLNTVLSWLFNNVLAPLLKNVLWPLIEAALNLVVKILAGVLYSIFAKILSLVDLLNSLFDTLIGLNNVTYKGVSMPLLEAVFSVDGLRKAYWAITCMGLALACLLTIYATVKSTIDLDFDNKRPVSRVLSAFFKCFIQLFSVQFVILFLIKLSGLILKGIDTAMLQISGGSNTTLGRMVFVVASMKACSSNKALNLGGSQERYVGINDSVRKAFYELNGGKLYTDIDTVEKYFDLAKFDYVIGLILSIFLLVIMAMCLMIFVRRIFDLVLLYLVSPLFVAMIPMDDGEKFAKWKEMFIGKCFSGFGMVMAMKMYIMLCPSIMGSDLKFSASTELNYMTKMVFLLGGAWAVLKSGGIVTALLSGEGSIAEQQTAEMTGGAVIAAGGTAVSVASTSIQLIKLTKGKGQKFEGGKRSEPASASGLKQGSIPPAGQRQSSTLPSEKPLRGGSSTAPRAASRTSSHAGTGSASGAGSQIRESTTARTSSHAGVGSASGAGSQIRKNTTIRTSSSAGTGSTSNSNRNQNGSAKPQPRQDRNDTENS